MYKTLIKNRQNLYKENYYNSKTNYVICIDHSQLGQQGFIFCAIDLAGVGHCFKDKVLNFFDVIKSLKEIVEFYPKYK
jgi:hypothetical protein